MSTTVRKKTSLPSVMSDWLSPISSFWDRDFFDSDLGLFSRRLGLSVPSANISETPQAYLLELAAPGLKRDDFKLEVENHTLTISSEKQEEKEEKKNGYSRKEYSFNSFSRSFTLPDSVKESDISASYTDGILKITIPKTEETPEQPARAIPVS
ncbi:Hsp20/alpha crystallin family protein [Parapedobacter defluvii]|nr:Hsp20/alpha crystallin family protein [Parapedobacter defluvii]RQP18127.1 MAG: Hsp20/alpha crystallin family protein [Parapedobacter sp.]